MRHYGLATAFVLSGFLVTTAYAQDAELQESLNDQVVSLTEQVKAEGPMFMLSGTLEKGKEARYSVNGEDFDVDDATELYGENSLTLGQKVQASGLIRDGKKTAEKVIIQEKRPSLRSSEEPLQSLDSTARSREPGPVQESE